MNNTVYQYSAEQISGKEILFEEFKGKTLLIVNTASECGFTPQYKGLEKLYQQYKGQGLVVLGFPCDQFRNQEPGSNEEILNFCTVNYGVSFPLFKKVDVNGATTHPLFQYLKKELSGFLGSRIKWNFTKFLIGPNGTPLNRFAPTTSPEKIEAYIKPLMK